MVENLDLMLKLLKQNRSPKSPWASMIKDAESRNNSFADLLLEKFIQVYLRLSHERNETYAAVLERSLSCVLEEEAIQLRFKMLFAAHLCKNMEGDFTKFGDVDALFIRDVEDTQAYFVFKDLSNTHKSANPDRNASVGKLMDSVGQTILKSWLQPEVSNLEQSANNILVLDLTRQEMSWLRPLETWQIVVDEIVHFQRSEYFKGLIICFASLDSNQVSSVYGLTESNPQLLYLLTSVKQDLLSENF